MEYNIPIKKTDRNGQQIFHLDDYFSFKKSNPDLPDPPDEVIGKGDDEHCVKNYMIDFERTK